MGQWPAVAFTCLKFLVQEEKDFRARLLRQNEGIHWASALLSTKSPPLPLSMASNGFKLCSDSMKLVTFCNNHRHFALVINIHQWFINDSSTIPYTLDANLPTFWNLQHIIKNVLRGRYHADAMQMPCRCHEQRKSPTEAANVSKNALKCPKCKTHIKTK